MEDSRMRMRRRTGCGAPRVSAVECVCVENQRRVWVGRDVETLAF